MKILARSIKNQLDTQSFIENLNFAVPQRSTRQNLQFELYGFRTSPPNDLISVGDFEIISIIVILKSLILISKSSIYQ
jgi:hypothetical protein